MRCSQWSWVWVITFGSVLEFSLTSLKVEKLSLNVTPQEFFANIKQENEIAFLLESSTGSSRLAEYSFIGFDPVMTFAVIDGKAEVRNRKTGTNERLRTDDPLGLLRRLVPPDSVSSLFRFTGGAVGYVSYDSVRYMESIEPPERGYLSLPEMEFGIFTDGVVFDHLGCGSYYYTLGESRLEEVKRFATNERKIGRAHFSSPKLSVSRERFVEMVERAKEYIFAGDVFQVVLSKRYELESEGDMMGFYSALSRLNPSPYMYFMKFDDRQVVGSSPEMLVRVEQGRVETYPIAGTRKSYEDREKNDQHAEELLADEKERAEHTMLVDLARNDIGRVSKFGSVSVPEFFTVQRFSHVQHIVSHVVGELKEGLCSYDAFSSVFPAGTVSGAPKVRAMEIIRELEMERRGPYAGAVGYFSLNGNADFAIAIRTLVAQGRRCSVQTGAGIVADSVPEREWEETEAKAAALLAAAKLASGEVE